MTAKIVEWDDARGFGYLQVGSGRLFLHHREFAERHKRPEVGDLICFTVGLDAKGRTSARNATHVNDGGKVTAVAVFFLACLLVLPGIALRKAGADFRFASAYALVMGLISYGFYALDKRRARAKAWRISEAGLHLTELLGGWPGAFLAQRRLRHKVSKPGYQLIFWMIVLSYQFAAFDSLRDWQISKSVVKAVAEHRR
jgi:uncharacterized membrane protein YsdA (DUF1294 family)/cold shock CspA family protein